MWTYLGKQIREGRSWKDSDGITHPTSWGRWSDAEKTSMGMVWVDPAPSFDNRFWWDASTPKALEDVNAVDEDGEQMVILGLKSQWKLIIKQQASGLLSPTDWMIIKAQEVSDYYVPAGILAYRADVRTASNTIEAAIDSASDHSSFIALFDSPTDDDGNAPIANWPQEMYNE